MNFFIFLLLLYYCHTIVLYLVQATCCKVSKQHFTYQDDFFFAVSKHIMEYSCILVDLPVFSFVFSPLFASRLTLLNSSYFFIVNLFLTCVQKAVNVLILGYFSFQPKNVLMLLAFSPIEKPPLSGPHSYILYTETKSSDPSFKFAGVDVVVVPVIIFLLLSEEMEFKQFYKERSDEGGKECFFSCFNFLSFYCSFYFSIIFLNVSFLFLSQRLPLYY